MRAAIDKERSLAVKPSGVQTFAIKGAVVSSESAINAASFLDTHTPPSVMAALGEKVLRATFDCLPERDG
jgi:hypothetical protein